MTAWVLVFVLTQGAMSREFHQFYQDQDACRAAIGKIMEISKTTKIPATIKRPCFEFKSKGPELVKEYREWYESNAGII